MNSNDFKREELRDFIARVEYQNGEKINRASGVIIRTKSSSYILTVKHTLKKSSKQPLSSVKVVDSNLIDVYDYDKKPIPISEVIFLENVDLDIALLKINVSKYTKIERIKTLELYMGEFNFCSIAGYPESRKDNLSVIIEASNPDEIENNPTSFQLKSKSALFAFDKSEMDILKGLSGGGIFKRGESGKIYLIGIQYEYTGYRDYLKCLDLRKIIDDIKAKIGEELILGKYPFFEKLGIDASKLNFESLENNFRLNKDIAKIKKSGDEYKFLLEDNKKNRNLEKSYLSLKKQMKKLADIYIYHGKVFFDNDDRVRAFNAFTRAMELYPEYKIYFLKDEFNENPLTNEHKRAREDVNEKTKISSDSDITEIILEDNIKSNNKNNESDSLEKNIEKLISFFSQKFDKNKQRIIEWLIKLSNVKLENGKPIEAEKILLNVRDELDGGERRYKINILLKDIYYQLINSKNTSISSYELRLKLEKLLIDFDTKEELYLSITNMITNIRIIKYYDNDCFIGHLASQRQEIKILKNRNYKLKLQNDECYSKISYQPILLKDSNKEKNIRIFWDIYCKTRFVIVTILGIIPIVIWINTW